MLESIGGTSSCKRRSTNITRVQGNSRDEDGTVVRNALDDLYDSLTKVIDANMAQARSKLSSQIARIVAESNAAKLTRSRPSARLRRRMVEQVDVISRISARNAGDDDGEYHTAVDNAGSLQDDIDELY